MYAHTIKNTQQRSSPAEGRKKPKKITQSYLHNAGLYYLQRFASSRQNFITVMDRKIRKSCHVHTDQNYESCKAMLETLADTFERSGLLNDDLYINGMIQSLRRRGYSRSGILQKLTVKGITRDVALTKLQQNDNDGIDEEWEAALKFARKRKLGPYATKTDENSTKKFFASLARAGYSYDTARKILNADLEDAY
jgi:regulatory protein